MASRNCTTGNLSKQTNYWRLPSRTVKRSSQNTACSRPETAVAVLSQDVFEMKQKRSLLENLTPLALLLDHHGTKQKLSLSETQRHWHCCMTTTRADKSSAHSRQEDNGSPTRLLGYRATIYQVGDQAEDQLTREEDKIGQQAMLPHLIRPSPLEAKVLLAGDHGWRQRLGRAAELQLRCNYTRGTTHETKTSANPAVTLLINEEVQG